VPVVVDKPLAATAGGARDVVAAAAAAGVPLTVFQNRRYDPELAALLSVRDSGVVGDVVRAEYRWDRWRPVPKQRWRETQSAEQGAGLLLDLGSHLFDQAVLLHGRVTSVYAEAAARTMVAEDDVFVACRHVTGVISHVSASSVNGAPGPRARLMGSAGAFVIGTQFDETGAFGDFDGPPGHVGWVVRGAEREPGPRAVPSHQADFYVEVAAALGEAEVQTAMPVDPGDAVHVLDVIDAARLSAREGRVVTPGCG
jgi:predicted dehydrogenase